MMRIDYQFRRFDDLARQIVRNHSTHPAQRSAWGYAWDYRLGLHYPAIRIAIQGTPDMLIALGGLPGTGKTTVAQTLARKLAAVYLRIDTLEQAFIRSGSGQADIGPGGYLAGYAVAADNLRLGLTVVADSVNALQVTRSAWRNVALEAGVPLFEVELICSDTTKHRLRVEAREADIPGHQLPTWKSVLERQYDPWNSQHLLIDTAYVSVEHAVETIIRSLSVSPPDTRAS
jgi:predicted kinase